MPPTGARAAAALTHAHHGAVSVLRLLRRPQRDGCALLVLLACMGPERTLPLLVGLVSRGLLPVRTAALLAAGGHVCVVVLQRFLGARVARWVLNAWFVAAIATRPTPEERPHSLPPAGAVLLLPGARAGDDGRAQHVVRADDLGVASAVVVVAEREVAPVGNGSGLSSGGGNGNGHEPAHRRGSSAGSATPPQSHHGAVHADGGGGAAAASTTAPVVLVGAFARWVNVSAVVSAVSTPLAGALRGALQQAEALGTASPAPPQPRADGGDAAAAPLPRSATSSPTWPNGPRLSRDATASGDVSFGPPRGPSPTQPPPPPPQPTKKGKSRLVNQKQTGEKDKERADRGHDKNGDKQHKGDAA